MEYCIETVGSYANTVVTDANLGKNTVVAAVLDVNIEKFIDGKNAGKVDQINKNFDLYIDLENADTRTYSVYRESEGKLELMPITMVSETRGYFASDNSSRYYIVYSEAHEHAFGEWKTSQDASWLHRGYEERTCECGEKETRRVEESWAEWLVGAVGRRLRNLFH